MRRFVLVFLLFLMPLQLSWAAAAAYCDHEEGSTRTHFGHHQHHHQSSHRASAADPAKDSKAKVPFGDDADCAFCHMAVAQTMISAPIDLLILPAAVPQFSYRLDFRSHIPPTPEIPDRLLAV
jgi:hypothetical protein